MTNLKNDYIYLYILKFILSYNYITTFKNYPFNIFTFADTEFKHLNIEAVNYALVSKKWFQMLRDELSRLSKFKNYNCLKYFMDYNGDSKFKLINQEGSVMMYNSLEDYNCQDKEITNQFKKIFIVEEDRYIAQNIMLSNQVYSSNVQFHLHLIIDPGHFRLDYPHGSRDLDYSTSLDFYKFKFDQFLINPKRIHTVDLLELDIGRDENSAILLNNINKLNAKQMMYKPVNEDEEVVRWKYNSFTSILYNSSSYERIRVVNGIHVPSDYLQITSSLKNLSLVFDFNSIVDNKSDEVSWNQLLELNLLKNQSIQYLELYNPEGNDDEQVSDIKQLSFFANGFYKLFSNTICTIERLELNNFNIQDTSSSESDAFFNGLVANTSIKTIIFYNTRSAIYFEKVFSKQQHHSIRNIIILGSNEDELFKIIKSIKSYSSGNGSCNSNGDNSSGSGIYLYSLTFETEEGLSLSLVDQLIIKINKYNFNIKEYNFYIRNDQVIIDSIILLNNGSMVNLRKVSNKENESDVEIWNV